MKRWGEVEVMHHKVTLYGHVFHRDGRPCSGAFVTAQRTSKLKKKSKADGPIDMDVESGRSHCKSTESRRDGLFFFLDLPEGDYLIRAEERLLGERGHNSAKVIFKVRAEQQITVSDIELSLA